MSEYQCYEFVAIDRPLTPKQMTELRAVSTRDGTAARFAERLETLRKGGARRRRFYDRWKATAGGAL